MKDTPGWLIQIDEFADALSERAIERRGYISQTDLKADTEYMQKAARLLKIMTVAYSNLSTQVNLFYEKEEKLKAEAAEIVEIVQNQMKMVEH